MKSWFDVYFLIPPAEYIGFPFSIFSQLTRCLIVLFKLSTLDDPAWDKSFVRNTADVILIMNQVIFNLRQVNWLAKLEDDNPEVNIFSRGADSYEAIRTRWEAKLAESQVETETLTPQSMDNVVTESGVPVPLLDDVWFSEIFASWDCL